MRPNLQPVSVSERSAVVAIKKLALMQRRTTGDGSLGEGRDKAEC